MLKKNQEIELTITALGSDLEGIGHYEGQTIFVQGALPNETIIAHILKTNARYAFAKIVRILKPSKKRQEPLCTYYSSCGGCHGQHMTYNATLEGKTQQVKDCLQRIGGLSLENVNVHNIIGSNSPLHFRNKTALPIRGTWQNPQIGFFKKRSHSLVDIKDCPITMGDIEGLLIAMRSYITKYRVMPYNEVTHKGILRHVIMRNNRLGQAMIILVTTIAQLPSTNELIELLKENVKGFSSLHISVNREKNNVILGRNSKHLYGETVLVENLDKLSFDIAPLSFFQVNPDQTEKLYQSAIDFANLQPNDIVVDAYAGAGTIALYMAQKATKVIGIEIVPQAVDSAIKNAEKNQVKNVEFYCEPVESKLPKLVKEGLRPHVVMLDPPRKGVDPPVIEAVLTAKPRTIVYVSCHVPTQARDVKALVEGGYKLTQVQPVDMFCYTSGIENIVCLEREDFC